MADLDADDWVAHAPQRAQADDWVAHAPTPNPTAQMEPITDYSRQLINTPVKPEDPGVLKSLGRGLEVGLATPIGNIDRASDAMLNKIGIETGAHQRYANFQKNLQRPDIAAELNTGAGETGKIAGEIGATLPIAAITENPWAVGAATGALNTDANGLPGAVLDTATGAIGGKAGQVLARGAGALVSRAVNRFAPNVTMDSGPAAPGIARQAAGYVARLMQSSGLTPDDLIKTGTGITKPVTSAEVIGPNGVTAIGALARREGATGASLKGLVDERASNQGSRMLDDYAGASGIDPILARGDIDSYVDSARKTVKPMFDQALGGDSGVWNGKLSMLAQRPAVQKAMTAVVEDLRNADVDPAGLGFTAQDPTTGKFVQQPRPTAQAWDMVKKRLGTLGERDAFGKLLPDSQSPGNYSLNKANGDLTAAMRDAIPGYGDALDASGDYLKVKGAFDRGSDFILNPKVSVAQVEKHVSGLSQPEQEAFKGGVAAKLFDQAQNNRLSPTIFNRPILQRKLAAAIGPDNATKFLAGVKNEANMQQAGNFMKYNVNSPTAGLQAAMAEQDQVGGLPAGISNFAGDLVKKRSLIGATVGAVDRGIGNLIANRKAVGMPIPVRDEAGRLLMMHPADLGQYMKGALTQTSPTAQFASRAVPQIENSVVPQIVGATAGAGVGEQFAQ